METTAKTSEEISTTKLTEFVQHVLHDMSAAENIRMSFLGTQLGLYKAMAFAGPLTVGEISRRSGASIKIVKQWVDKLAAEGYLLHDPELDTFTLPAEHAIALTDPGSAYYIGERFQLNHTTKASKTKGQFGASPVTWSRSTNSKHDTSRLLSEEYITNLLKNWLPAVEGLVERLNTGITVADLGAGRHGASTLVLAAAFPASTFLGYDRYASSVERANLLAKEKRIGNAHFELATEEQVHATKYDLITLIESMQQLGSPEDMLSACYEVLKPDGVLVVVEAKDSTQVGEELYQRLHSPRTRLATEEIIRVEMGIDDRERKLQRQAGAAGFSLFRKVAETLYEKVYEIRP